MPRSDKKVNRFLRVDYIMLFSVAFIILSIVTWFVLLTQNAKVAVTEKYGQSSAEVFNKIISLPADFVLFTLSLSILVRIKTYSRYLLTIFFGWLNIFLYIIEPIKFFRWVSSEKVNAK